MSEFSVSYIDIEQWQEEISKYPENAEEVINEVLHEQSFAPLTESIKGLIHGSGRTWKGKKAGAKTVQPFTQKNENLSIEIKSKKSYHYLYFPDDGSNTKRHNGDQQFMLRGVEKETDKVKEMCLERLMKDWSD